MRWDLLQDRKSGVIHIQDLFEWTVCDLVVYQHVPPWSSAPTCFACIAWVLRRGLWS